MVQRTDALFLEDVLGVVDDVEHLVPGRRRFKRFGHHSVVQSDVLHAKQKQTNVPMLQNPRNPLTRRFRYSSRTCKSEKIR